MPRWPGRSRQNHSPWRSRATVERPRGDTFSLGSSWQELRGSWKGLGLGNMQTYMSRDFEKLV